MASLNKILLIGRLGRDPEVKYTSSGSAVAKFSIATDESYKDRNGEQQKHTEWHNIVAWNKLAEICGQYLKKGAQVLIEGSVKTSEWEDSSGSKRTRHEVIARNMQMLGGGGNAKASAGEQPVPDDEELPF
jgi:single-strand DNA-binding protein